MVQLQETPSGRKYVGDWVIGKTIGVGSSGKVKLASHRNVPELKFVVKCIHKPSASYDDKTDSKNTVWDKAEPLNLGGSSSEIGRQESYIVNEAGVNIHLDHPNIVKLYDMHTGTFHVYLFFEYVAGEDLIDFITRQKSKRLSEKKARSIFRKLVSALEYAHRNHIVHRDIKLENIRYQETTDEVKVIDFGFSSFYSEHSMLEANCGSPCYAPPEIYENQPYKGPEVDVWSLGICLHGMVTGTLPFDGKDYHELKDQIKNATNITFDSFISEDLRDLLKRMICPEPRNRISMREIGAHRWVNKNFKVKPFDYFEHERRTPRASVASGFADMMVTLPLHEASAILSRQITNRIQDRMTDLVHSKTLVEIPQEIHESKQASSSSNNSTDFSDSSTRGPEKRRRGWFLNLFGSRVSNMRFNVRLSNKTLTKKLFGQSRSKISPFSVNRASKFPQRHAQLNIFHRLFQKGASDNSSFV